MDTKERAYNHLIESLDKKIDGLEVATQEFQEDYFFLLDIIRGSGCSDKAIAEANKIMNSKDGEADKKRASEIHELLSNDCM